MQVSVNSESRDVAGNRSNPRRHGSTGSLSSTNDDMSPGSFAATELRRRRRLELVRLSRRLMDLASRMAAEAFDLYVVISEFCAGRTPLDVLDACLRAGVRLIQFRESPRQPPESSPLKRVR